MPRSKSQGARRQHASAPQSTSKPWPFMFTLGIIALIPPAFAGLKTLHARETSYMLYTQLILSVLSFAAYGFDKNRATYAGWRTRETSLLLLDALGGWPGGFAAQYYFRHKIRKTSFQLFFWTIVLTHEILWINWLVPANRKPIHHSVQGTEL